MDAIITVADKAAIEDVTKALEAVGLKDTKVLKGIGMVTGSYAGRLDDLRAVEGVESVEVSRTVYAQES